MADVVLCWISSGALANNAVSPEMEMSDMSYKSCRGHAIWISRSTDYWVLGALIWQWTTETGEALGTCLACCPTCRFDIFQNSWWLLTEGTECSCKVYVETTWHHYCMTTYHLLPCLQKHVNPFFVGIFVCSLLKYTIHDNISGRQHLYEVGKGVRRLYKGFRDICQAFGVVSVWGRWIVNCWSLQWNSVVWHGCALWTDLQVFGGLFFTCIHCQMLCKDVQNNQLLEHPS